MSRTPPLATCLAASALLGQFFFALFLFITVDIANGFTPRLLVEQFFLGLVFLVLIWGVWTQRRWGLGGAVGFEIFYISSLFEIWTPPTWGAFLGLPVLAILYYILVPVLVLLLCLIAFLARPFRTAFFRWWPRHRKG